MLRIPYFFLLAVTWIFGTAVADDKPDDFSCKALADLMGIPTTEHVAKTTPPIKWAHDHRDEFIFQTITITFADGKVVSGRLQKGILGSLHHNKEEQHAMETRVGIRDEQRHYHIYSLSDVVSIESQGKTIFSNPQPPAK